MEDEVKRLQAEISQYKKQLKTLELTNQKLSDDLGQATMTV